MTNLTYTRSSLLGSAWRKVYENLYTPLSAAQYASAYEGVHDDWCAEPEFAGKYMDISMAYYRATGDRAALENAKTLVHGVIRGQRDDGYLGTLRPGMEYEVFSVWNQTFTVFGLLSYWEETGDEAALAAARRCIDKLSRDFMTPGGPLLMRSINAGTQHLSILYPAVQLYAATGEARYLDFCRFILDTLEASPNHNLLSNQKATALGSLKGIEMFVIFLGICAYGEVTGDSRCLEAAAGYWQNLRDSQIRETGCGTIAENWGYAGNAPSMLPEQIKPNENCVAVGWMELSLRLYSQRKDGQYFDAFEQSLYNHLLGSLAPDGSDFAYYQGNYGTKKIATAHGMYSCCRFRGLTMMAHLTECALFADGDGLWLPLYADYTAETAVRGVTVRVRMKTEYPRDGRIRVELTTESKAETRIHLRVPAWCPRPMLTWNGVPTEAAVERGHIILSCALSPIPTVLTLDFAPEVHRKDAVVDDQPCALYTFGPLVLSMDSAFGTPIFSSVIDAEAPIVPMTACGSHLAAFAARGTVRGKPAEITLVDYASAGMGNPGHDRFRIWIPTAEAEAGTLY